VFVDRNEVLSIARDAARRIAASDPNVVRVILFGSFTRNEYGPRSDLDLLVILNSSDRPARERAACYLRHVPPFPMDLLVITQPELEEKLASREAFLLQAIREGVQLFP
jgi:predicted nucleotidyltransferase